MYQLMSIQSYVKHNRFRIKIVVVVCVLFVIIVRLINLVGNSDDIGIESRIGEVVGLPEDVDRHTTQIDKGQTEKVLIVDFINTTDDSLSYWSVKNLGKSSVTPRMTINGKGWYSNDAILDQALGGVDRANGEVVGKAIWKFIVENRYHHEPPTYGDSTHVIFGNPLQYLNSWGYGFCSDSATIFAKLAVLAGYKARVVYLNEHVVAEIYYNWEWHMFDTDREVFFVDKDDGVVSVEQIINDNSFVRQVNKVFSQSDFEYKRQVLAYQLAEPKNIIYSDYYYPNTLPQDFVYHLRGGEEIRFYYNWPDKYYWSWVEDKPPRFTNGLLITKIDLDYFIKEELLIEVNLPYPMLGSFVYGSNVCEDVDRISFSIDNKHWKQAGKTCVENGVDLSDFFPIGEETLPTNRYWLRIKNHNLPLFVFTQFQVSPFSLPRVVKTDNLVELQESLQEDLEINFVFKSSL